MGRRADVTFGKATDEEVEDLRCRHEYDGKQAAEPVTVGRLSMAGDAFGAGIASAGERYLGNGRWAYCTSKRHCRAEQTIVDVKRRQGTRIDGD